MLPSYSLETPKANTTTQSQVAPAEEVTHLRQVTRQQWRSGIAARLGWTFDGLDMHFSQIHRRQG